MDINLSDAQRDAIIRLGSTDSLHEVIDPKIFEQLHALGLVYKRAEDGHFDFTSLGEATHESLVDPKD